MVNSDKIFNAWKYSLKEEGGGLYLYQNRRSHIEQLIEYFCNNGVDYETALTYKRDVLHSLTTKEGRKGKGKYKGWSENVVVDFEEALAFYYTDKEGNLDDIVLERDSEISRWVDEKFNGNEKILIEAQKVGSFYYLKFIGDMYNEH